MILTEPRHPPSDYLPERVYAPTRPVNNAAPQIVVSGYLAQALYRGWPHDDWAFRHWRTKHNCHVEHWHGESLPGRCA